MRRYTLKDGDGHQIGSYETPAAIKKFGVSCDHLEAGG
jgi:hypothetical protein